MTRDLESRLDKALRVIDKAKTLVAAERKASRPTKPGRSPCPKCRRYIAFVWARGQWVRAGHRAGRIESSCERSGKADEVQS